jgi:hypothetical protein
MRPRRRPSAAIQSRIATSTSSKPAGRPWGDAERVTTIRERPIRAAIVETSGRCFVLVITSASGPVSKLAQSGLVPLSRPDSASGSMVQCQGGPRRAAVRQSRGMSVQCFGRDGVGPRACPPASRARSIAKISSEIASRFSQIFAVVHGARLNSAFRSTEYYRGGVLALRPDKRT